MSGGPQSRLGAPARPRGCHRPGPLGCRGVCCHVAGHPALATPGLSGAERSRVAWPGVGVLALPPAPAAVPGTYSGSGSIGAVDCTSGHRGGTEGNCRESEGPREVLPKNCEPSRDRSSGRLSPLRGGPARVLSRAVFARTVSPRRAVDGSRGRTDRATAGAFRGTLPAMTPEWRRTGLSLAGYVGSGRGADGRWWSP